MHDLIEIRPVETKADRDAFLDLPYRLYADDRFWVPPLKSEMRGLITPGENPWFEHGEAQLFLARREGRVTGRISAHIDHLALAQPAEKGFGPGTGHWGLLEAEDAETMAALIDRAEAWLREKSMTRVIAPISLSIWDEPGLLTSGFEQSPTVMMGHHKRDYADWIERTGYRVAKRLYCYELDIVPPLPPLILRIIKSGERNPRIRIRKVNKADFAREADLVLSLLNDAWADNWGFVPLTQGEKDYAGKKLKAIVFEGLVRVAEVEGEPVAFMITLPDLNEALRPLNGRLFPFGWARLLWWLRAPKVRTVRVPLMGVAKRLQNTRLASQLAFMLIEEIRAEAVAKFGAVRGEIGWILEDNQGMVAIADGIGTKVNKTYTLYEKLL